MKSRTIEVITKCLDEFFFEKNRSIDWLIWFTSQNNTNFISLDIERINNYRFIDCNIQSDELRCNFRLMSSFSFRILPYLISIFIILSTCVNKIPTCNSSNASLREFLVRLPWVSSRSLNEIPFDNALSHLTSSSCKRSLNRVTGLY